MYFTEKSALRAKHTVKQLLRMEGNLFSNQLEYQISLVFASETKILSTVIYCRGHSFVFEYYEIKPIAYVTERNKTTSFM